MPRPGVRKNYSDEDVINAVASIKNGTLKYREASEMYKVPMSTLCDKIKLTVPLVGGKTGWFF